VRRTCAYDSSKHSRGLLSWALLSIRTGVLGCSLQRFVTKTGGTSPARHTAFSSVAAFGDPSKIFSALAATLAPRRIRYRGTPFPPYGASACCLTAPYASPCCYSSTGRARRGRCLSNFTSIGTSRTEHRRPHSSAYRWRPVAARSLCMADFALRITRNTRAAWLTYHYIAHADAYLAHAHLAFDLAFPAGGGGSLHCTFVLLNLLRSLCLLSIATTISTWFISGRKTGADGRKKKT